nr:hypothetical protein [Culturomica massiliensis]
MDDIDNNMLNLKCELEGKSSMTATTRNVEPNVISRFIADSCPKYFIASDFGRTIVAGLLISPGSPSMIRKENTLKNSGSTNA